MVSSLHKAGLSDTWESGLKSKTKMQLGRRLGCSRRLVLILQVLPRHVDQARSLL